jgi:type 1 glutamine amidotransferase
MEPSSAPLVGPKNDPMMPIAWTRLYNGKNRIFTTTMGSAQDMTNEGFRRLIVNATYWAAGLEKKIPRQTQVELVGEFHPTPFKFNGYIPGRKPEHYAK